MPLPSASFLAGLGKSLRVKVVPTAKGPHTVVKLSQFKFPMPGANSRSAEFMLTSTLTVSLSPKRFDAYMAKQINPADQREGRKLLAVHLGIPPK
ncbi:MAG TPA: hypothetical protein VNH82_02285 [Candidatus Dormibacteraeota bacterium]|nr:hypothetical protein [Candidatus Dormibacteraeota bacterium]